MKQYALKHKWLFFVPIIGMIYIILLGPKIGFLTRLSNLNGWEVLAGTTLHAFSIVFTAFGMIIKF